MNKSIILGCTALAFIAAGVAQAKPGDRLRARLGNQNVSSAAPEAPGKQTLAYGADKQQELDFWPAQGGKGAAPLVVFVHGGGWKRGSKDNATGPWKAPHYSGAGYAYAAINYRLVPDATVEQQAADVAASLKYLIANARRLGIDPNRIVIMGHSAGAQLVALVGTDERYLKAAGLSFNSLAGVIPIDGAAYDVTRQISAGKARMKDTYLQAFGTDPVRQRALSPTFQAAAPNAPRFLLIHVQRPDGVQQNEELEAALRQNGTTVTRQGFAGEGLSGHMEINRSLGDPSYAATGVVDAWLKAVFGR